jgi:hypothetical protein
VFSQCNRCWRTRGGRPKRLGNRSRGAPIVRCGGFRLPSRGSSTLRVSGSFSPPCWTGVIPHYPTRWQDLTPDCPWPRNPSPGATRIWQGPSAFFLFCPPFWHFFYIVRAIRPGVTSPETTRQLALGRFLFHFIIFFFTPGLTLTYLRLFLGRVEGRKDPEDFPRIRTA